MRKQFGECVPLSPEFLLFVLNSFFRQADLTPQLRQFFFVGFQLCFAVPQLLLCDAAAFFELTQLRFEVSL